MYLTAIPYRPEHYALVTESGGVLVLTYTEAKRISETPFRSFHSISERDQRRVIAASRTQAVAA